MQRTQRGTRTAGRLRRPSTLWLGLASIVIGASLAWAAPAGAAALTVTNANNTGSGSLRQAIATAAGSSGDDTITVNAGLGTIMLATPISFAANGALTIIGNGVTVNANGADGAIVATGGTGALTIDNMTITGAEGTSTIAGALIVRSTGDLTLSNCSVSRNTATPEPFANAHGAAVVRLGSGATTISKCSFTENAVSGAGTARIAGALDIEGGALTITESELSGNSAADFGQGFVGGAINAKTGPVTITNSSIASNDVTADVGDLAGGGVLSSSGPLSIVNSTISSNSVAGPVAKGAGGVLSAGGAFSLVYTTVASNKISEATAANIASNVRNDGAALTPFGSVITPVSSGVANCVIKGSATTTAGYNFSDDASCGLSGSTDHQSAGSADLGALTAPAGAPGQVRIPQTGSPLIDAIPIANCKDDGASAVTTDELGTSRPQALACDIGAIEVPSDVVPPTTTAVATEQLPRTGSGTTLPLTILGSAVLLGGLVLVRGSRRRSRR